MSEKLSRRDFLKVVGTGAGAAAILTGCGSMARHVQRQPYASMPEYSMHGKDVLFATTCGECPAGCGLIAQTREGRLHKVDGNPDHPVNHGNTCARGQASLEGLYNPDRLKAPAQATPRGSGNFQDITWEAAAPVVQDALQNHPAGSIAFLLGLRNDHLADVVQLISAGLGGANVLRYSAQGEFDGRVTLLDAAQKLFGEAKLPFFDIANATVTFSFGANFAETWLSPVAYARAYGEMRQGNPGQRGYLVQFEARMSQTAATADEWIPIVPGSEALLAQALAKLLSERQGNALPVFGEVDVAEAAAACGVSEANLRRLAAIFMDAPRAVAIPGGGALGQSNGLAAAQAILTLNWLTGSLSQRGGVYLMPNLPVYPELVQRPSSLAEMAALVERMQAGEIQALFVHGVNPVFELPKSLGFAEALKQVPLIISFSAYRDETSVQANYLLPDHTPLESWGYQKILPAADRLAISAQQPVVTPLYDTRATADLLLAASQSIGGGLAQAVPYRDIVAFLQQAVSELQALPGAIGAVGPAEFWTHWLQMGGWWTLAPGLDAANATSGLQDGEPAALAGAHGEEADYPLRLLIFPHPNLADGSGANRPWLQETMDPMTTVMWNSWVEINPETAHELGVTSDDIVQISSPAGSLEAVVYEYPAIHPEVIAIPFGQGHTDYGRYASGRGVNPFDLLSGQQNETGSLATQSTQVKVTPTGKRRPLARYESKAGIYGQAEPDQH